MVRVPGAVTEMATRWLTDKLLQSRVFVNTVESGHRFYKDMQEGMREGITDEPVKRAKPPPDEAPRQRATARSTYHADREQARARNFGSSNGPSASGSSDRTDSSAKKPPDQDVDAQLQELLRKMRDGK